jgi:hypothetical protein
LCSFSVSPQFQGGTSFGRWVGGPGIITSYDYDAAVDEFGIPNPAKFNQSATLHYWLRHYEAALVGVSQTPTAVTLGSQQEGTSYVYNGTGVVFLANDAKSAVEVMWPVGSSAKFTIPAWSVSIVDAITLQVQFNTATGPYVSWEALQMPTKQENVSTSTAGAGDQNYRCWKDTFGLWNPSAAAVSSSPLEQLSITHDQTDYLFYIANVTLSADALSVGEATVTVTELSDYALIGLQQTSASGELLLSLSSMSWAVTTVPKAIKLSNLSPASGWHEGAAQLIVMSQALGLKNIGMNLELIEEGFASHASIHFNSDDISNRGWLQLPGLQGEWIHAFSLSSQSSQWRSRLQCADYASQPLLWLRLQIHLPLNADPTGAFAVDLGSMSKGAVWVNGHHIGRYWLTKAVDSTNNCAPCTYAQSYDTSTCRTGCGEPSQRYYHVPRAWLVDGLNEITLLEENPIGDMSRPANVTITRMGSKPSVDTLGTGSVSSGSITVPPTFLWWLGLTVTLLLSPSYDWAVEALPRHLR